MKIKIKEWLGRQFRRVFPAPVDTTPDAFDAWFRLKLGEALQGGDVYYCVGIAGQKNVPNIGKNFRVFGEFEEAQKLRKELQYANPRLKLEIKLVRVFYSVPRV